LTGTDAKHVLEIAEPVACWQDVAVRYPYHRETAVGPVSMAIRPGERLLLLGPSGSGKSTLLQTLTGLIPQSILADVAGSVRLFGQEASARAPAQWASEVAQLFQNPEQMLCGMTVADEVAFALENQGLAATEIERRVVAALDRVGFPHDQRDRRTMTLSGGEKQIVALAAVLAQDAPLLVVDEPTAHLAPVAASRLRSLLLASRRASRGALIVDHRFEGMLGMIDRVVAIGADGTMIDGGEPREFFRRCHAKLVSNGIWVPLAVELDDALIAAGIRLAKAPLTMSEATATLAALDSGRRTLAQEVARSFAARQLAAAPTSQTETGVVAALSGVDCAPLFGPITLRDASLVLHRGETIAILGRNGAGKTTLGATLAGLLRPRQGRRSGPMGSICFQNPESQFLTGSVREELTTPLADRHLAEWGLAGLGDRHPFELSQGQKRRLALATVTAGRDPPLLVLDEPTAGLDAAGKLLLRGRIDSLAGQGAAIALITHDLDFALAVCRRAVIVGEGRVLADGPIAALMRDGALLARADLEEPPVTALLRCLESFDC
jgi:energy-coupling factor transport system ATP-binding protein